MKDWCQQLMELPLLAENHIRGCFKACVADQELLAALLDYMRQTWLKEEGLWQPKHWSMYQQSIRTNNYVEGWHRWLNQAAEKDNLLLHRESKLVNYHVDMVRDGLLISYQQKIYVNVQAKIFTK